MRMNGATYRRSVSGEELAWLCQRPVEMHVAALHENVLGGDMGCAGGEEKYYHRGVFLWSGHAFFEQNSGCAVLEAMWTMGPARPIKAAIPMRKSHCSTQFHQSLRSTCHASPTIRPKKAPRKELSLMFPI